VQEQEELQDLMDKIIAGHSNYVLVNMIAKRVKALHLGDRALVDVETGTDPVDIAWEEIKQGKLVLVPKKQPRKRKEAAASEFDEEE